MRTLTSTARIRANARHRPAPVPKAVIYARVSTKDQEREGFSIPAQLKLLRDYAASNGLLVTEEFVDIETARHVGRANFTQMARYLTKHAGGAILVEKTDRLYRNMKDYVTLDELGVDIHFVKEGTVLTRASRSSEKFMHGIKVLMAKNYIDNLSEEARKGMLEKAEQGIWPSAAPLGYRNIVGSDGKRIIEVDPAEGPIVAELFALYATGRVSLRDLTDHARNAGLRYRKSGTPVTTSAMHLMLRRRLYCGEFEWNGRIYAGKHEQLAPPELWLQVQGVLNGRHAGIVKTESDFAFAGLVTCGHCGCLAVAEIKKKKYIYYHCSGARGKCGEPYIREEALAAKFAEHLDRLHFPPGAFDRLREAMKESMGDVEAERKRAVAHLQSEYDRLADRLAKLYTDKVDGVVDEAFYASMSLQWRETQIRVLHEIETHHIAIEDHVDDVMRVLDLAQDARGVFEAVRPKAQRKLLDLVTSNSTYAHGELNVTFQTPFDLIEKAAPSAFLAEASKGGKVLKKDQAAEWLGN